MNARERARFDMIKRVGDFGAANAADFTTPLPPAVAVSAAQTKAKGLFDDLNTPAAGLIAQISANAATQQAGSGEGEETQAGATASSCTSSLRIRKRRAGCTRFRRRSMQDADPILRNGLRKCIGN